MERTLHQPIINDLPNKIILLSGPRQTGKTTLSKELHSSFQYLNFDSAEDRLIMKEKSWDREKQLIVFDELHKMKNWKRYLKGIYDTEGIPPSILVTGSAKLDIHKRVGDSLAGRYFQFRMHPFDLKEVKSLSSDWTQLFNQLWTCGGFPEPFLKNNATYYKRWRRTHLDIILRQDLIELYSGRDIYAIENLVYLLKDRVGSTISYANLARDLERDPTTIKRWLHLLENLYIIFKVKPYHKKIARSLLKEPKYYFYDHALIDHDDGAHLENIVASALLKELQFLEDTTGVVAHLQYLRTKDGKEIDFLIVIDNKPVHLIEIKWSDDNPSPNFNYFEKHLPKVKKTQLVKELVREKTFPNGLEIRALIPWLVNLELS